MQVHLTSSFHLPVGLRLALVGTGALGAELCRLLMRANHAEVLLIDPDRVEPHNVRFSPAFAGHLGVSKVRVLAAQARAEGLPWQMACAEVADVGLGALRGYDVLLSATDSALARVETAFVARSLRLPMLDAGVQSFGIPEGRVNWFAVGSGGPSADAACTLCGSGEARRAELLGFALSASLGCRLPEEPRDMSGAPATVRETAETMLRLLGDRFSAHAGEAAEPTSYALRLHTGGAQERIELTRSDTCPWHDLPSPDELVPLPWDEPLLPSLGPGMVLELPWPVCLLARCRHCGQLTEPMRRTAVVRRTLVCPGCERTGTLDPLRILASLGAEHALASVTPRQLGLPERHLYHRRRSLHAGPA